MNFKKDSFAYAYTTNIYGYWKVTVYKVIDVYMTDKNNPWKQWTVVLQDKKGKKYVRKVLEPSYVEDNEHKIDYKVKIKFNDLDGVRPIERLEEWYNQIKDNVHSDDYLLVCDLWNFAQSEIKDM